MGEFPSYEGSYKGYVIWVDSNQLASGKRDLQVQISREQGSEGKRDVRNVTESFQTKD